MEINNTIDQNFVSLETNAISQRSNAPESIRESIPDGALFFEGIVSNSEQNRNGYVIKSDAWFFNRKKYVKDFLKNGSVLWGHDSDKPIGRPLSFEKLENGSIAVTGYVYDDVHTNGAIGRGLVRGLSTGHITHERNWKNSENGKVKTDEEFFELSFDEIVSGNWIMQVLKAEIAEFSFVTIPSNRASVVANAIGNKLELDSEQIDTLSLKYESMKEPGKKKSFEENQIDENQIEDQEVEETTEDDIVTDEVNDVEETAEAPEGEAEEPNEEVEENAILDAIEKLGVSLRKEFQKEFETLTNKFEEVKKVRTSNKALVPNGTENNDSQITGESFRAKHFG